ncbi:amidohydrolase [Nakamurella sp. PAMC28650]|uniref:amidohydrolase n=1 Tax=Nakamurella sp. PAMC28650 TaxID=2762325 RepID=UPI00164DB555|nr:amidohydrolase family protein [Nakamurella sp. PAMC28650]QNK79811.1 amidohydrolase family protein [Nakamurella sp. PAMC28650]
MTTILLHGGRVHTAADPDATAVAITDGVISWIGAEHALEMAGRPDHVVDLDGALVTPGFVDAHVHTTDAGLALTGLALGAATSLADCLRRIGDAAAAVPPGELVWGHGWDETTWPENRPPTRAEIDLTVGNRPTYLSRVDVHSALVSTALVARLPQSTRSATIDPHLPQTRDGHHLVRNLAKSLLTPGRRAAAQRAFLSGALAAGIVEVHECAAGDESGQDDLRALLAIETPISVLGYLAAAVGDPEEARALLARTGAVALAGDLSVDGAIGSRTASLTHPYHDDPTTSGTRYLTDDQLAEHLWACASAGVQPGFHAIGDDGVSAVAHALRRATARLEDTAAGVGTVRMAGCVPRIEHAEMADAEAIATFAATGTVACMQPMFDAAWGGPDGMYARRLGRERAVPMNALARFASAGVALALSSDAPVTPASPWLAVQAAVHHRTAGSGLSSRAAFTAHTRGGHRAAGRTDRAVGTITVGAPAHLAIFAAGELVRPAANEKVARWSTDPRSRVPLLPDLTPGAPMPVTLATIVGGRVAHDVGLLAGVGDAVAVPGLT